MRTLIMFLILPAVMTAIFLAVEPAISSDSLSVEMQSKAHERYEMPSFLRGPHILAFWTRHNQSFKRGAAIHAAHGAAHDMVQQSFAHRESNDRRFNERFSDLLLRHPPKTEAVMQTYGPLTSQFAWQLYRTINWTHVHHEMTYDIMSTNKISWGEKKAWTDKAVNHYLKSMDIARSPAPLDITMRRAGTMMKPYFGYFRNYYPKSGTFFFAAHWWHPSVYEAQMIGGNDQEQVTAVNAVDTVLSEVVNNPPQRMLLSREIMPRYSMMSPESANIFDNLHMLHGIAYDILAYPKWTRKQKEAELYRVIKAMSYQPGDEHLARKFQTPRPNMDPRRYEPWMQSCEGEMNRIMIEMLDEMMPMMANNYEQKRAQAHEVVMKKLCPGQQPGEPDGSIYEAMMTVFPDMKMMTESMKPGDAAPAMTQAMMTGWFTKYKDLPDVPVMPMAQEPSLTSFKPIARADQAPGRQSQRFGED